MLPKIPTKTARKFSCRTIWNRFQHNNLPHPITLPHQSPWHTFGRNQGQGTCFAVRKIFFPMNTKSNSSCRGVWLFDDLAKYDARAGHLYDGVFEVQKGAELDTGGDYQGTEGATVVLNYSAKNAISCSTNSCTVVTGLTSHGN